MIDRESAARVDLAFPRNARIANCAAEPKRQVSREELLGDAQREANAGDRVGLRDERLNVQLLHHARAQVDRHKHPTAMGQQSKHFSAECER